MPSYQESFNKVRAGVHKVEDVMKVQEAIEKATLWDELNKLMTTKIDEEETVDSMLSKLLNSNK